MENLFTNVDDYYKPILVEVLSKITTNIVKAEEIKTKNSKAISKAISLQDYAILT